jgi:hypothetical protein
MPKGTPGYFKSLDAQRKAMSTPLDVTIHHEDGTVQHFVEPPKDNLAYKFQTQDVRDQLVDNALKEAHAADAARKKRK